MGMADLILAGEGDLYDINEYHMLAHLIVNKVDDFGTILAFYLIHFKFVGIKDMHNIYYLGLSGEHRCPLGYLFYFVINWCRKPVFRVNLKTEPAITSCITFVSLREI